MEINLDLKKIFLFVYALILVVFFISLIVLIYNFFSLDGYNNVKRLAVPLEYITDAEKIIGKGIIYLSFSLVIVLYTMKVISVKKMDRNNLIIGVICLAVLFGFIIATIFSVFKFSDILPSSYDADSYSFITEARSLLIIPLISLIVLWIADMLVLISAVEKKEEIDADKV